LCYTSTKYIKYYHKQPAISNMPGAPTLVQHVRQFLGRALRETGQAVDRLGLRTAMLASTPYRYHDSPMLFQDYLSRHRQYMPLLWSGRPVIHPQVAYIAPCATLIGSVTVGAGSSIWYGAVLRADECLNADAFKSEDEDNTAATASSVAIADESTTLMPEPWTLSDDRIHQRTDHHGGAIFIGNNTNVQDGCILTSRTQHTVIGDGVTIGHLAQIHSATIEDYCLIGMGSIIGEGARIETESLIAAGAVVKPGQVIPSGELWLGNPARKLKQLSAKERQRLHYQSSEYVAVATGQQGVMELGGNAVIDYGSHDDNEILEDHESHVLESLEESDSAAVSISKVKQDSITMQGH
jgi:carbonic anhydrase/acetyltransferase-like protein (isoleucine patch superfamily)